MKLHYFDGSTTCRPIVMFAAEAGLPLELVPVDLFTGEHLASDYTAKNPNQLVPLLEEPDGFLLTECSAILKYLADRTEHPAWPAEPRARAQVNARMDWFNTGFYRCFGYGVVYAQLFPDYGFADPFMQREALARATRKSERLFGILDAHMLMGPGPFLGGTEPDLSDYLGVAYATTGELVRWDMGRWPRVEAWIAAMRARPTWGGANAGFEAWRDQLRADAA